ncbi:MAG: YkgJ family cysteine cluster protein [Flavobacteriaceae bacterium]|nr:YkgJ family cysteine cluster protein [Flavobacteriaceae bacterium]
MFPSPQKLITLAKNKRKETQKFLKQLRKKPPKQLDNIMMDLHREAFASFDCLTCANCCKTTGPLFTDQDINRISKHLKMSARDFEDTYLKVDEDGDKVLQQVPCTFLGADNYCSIYDVRPKACREYPHTDRKKFYQINSLTLQNVEICPAAYVIVERLKEKLLQL